VAEGVVLDVVHGAIEMLLEIDDDPGHLFGYWQTEKTGYVLMRAVGRQVHRFRDHVNELFSTEEGLFVPNDMSAVPLRRPGEVCLR
jgi:hypothetical protein